MSNFVKDPEAILDWEFDWTDWLESGESISSRNITVDGVTLDSDHEQAGVVTVWISGGTAGSQSSIQCEITTSFARTDQRTANIAIRER